MPQYVKRTRKLVFQAKTIQKQWRAGCFGPWHPGNTSHQACTWNLHILRGLAITPVTPYVPPQRSAQRVAGGQQDKSLQAAAWLHFLPEPESSSSNCVSAGDLVACRGDVYFSYDRLHHPQLLDRPKPASLLLGNFMGHSVRKRGFLWPCGDVLKENQHGVLFLRMTQHSLEESMLPICKALLLATQGWLLLTLACWCFCTLSVHQGRDRVICHVSISNSNEAVDLIQSWVQTN